MLDLIQRRFSSRLITAATPEQAFSLYTDAQLLPGTSTSYILIEDYSLQLNGPFSEELPACILTATDMAGRPCIVKLLGRSESTSLPSTGRQTEADVCTQLQLAEANLAGIPVVHATLLEVALQGLEQHMQATKKHGPGVYRALLMPRYACVVSDQPQLTQQAILRGAERLVEAIKYIHGKDYVHMDVKVRGALSVVATKGAQKHFEHWCKVAICYHQKCTTMNCAKARAVEMVHLNNHAAKDPSGVQLVR